MTYKIIKTKTVFRTSDSSKKAPLTEINISELTEGLMPHAERVYFITNQNNSEEIRGKHYHLNTKEILLCATGKAFVEVHSKNSCEVIAIDRDNAIFIPEKCWHAVKMEENTMLLAIAEKAEKRTITADELLKNCCCKMCGKLLSFKNEIQNALNK